jgi:hypothetical protein
MHLTQYGQLEPTLLTACTRYWFAGVRCVQAKEKGTKVIDEDGLFALIASTQHIKPRRASNVVAELTQPTPALPAASGAPAARSSAPARLMGPPHTGSHATVPGTTHLPVPSLHTHHKYTHPSSSTTIQPRVHDQSTVSLSSPSFSRPSHTHRRVCTMHACPAMIQPILPLYNSFPLPHPSLFTPAHLTLDT